MILRRIGDDFAPADLRIPAAEKQGHAAQLVHADFKGNPRPGGGFVKDHPQGLSLQRLPGFPSFSIFFSRAPSRR